MSKMALPLAQLRGMSDDDLIRRHDEEAEATLTGVDYCLNELNRRDQARQTASMVRYTTWITFMTVVITVATLVNLGLLLCQR